MPRPRLAQTLLFTTIPLLVAIACMGIAILAAGGGIFPDLDILTHFAPLWLFACTGSLVLALLSRGGARGVRILISLVGMAAAGALIVPELVRDTGPRAPADAPDQIKVIQFNVWKNNPDVPGTVAWLVRENADIMILEETTAPMRKLLAAQPGWTLGCSFCETVMVSRLPFKSDPLPRGPDGKLLNQTPLPRARFADARGTFVVLAVHSTWPTDWRDQAWQEGRIVKMLDMYPRDRTILAGDFNSTPWSFSRRFWDSKFGIVRRERAIFSWPAHEIAGHGIALPFPLLPIDHLYAGPGWRTVSVQRGPRQTSDHYPLVAILAPVGPPSAPH